MNSTLLHTTATKEQVALIRDRWPSIRVEERFALDSVNLEVPNDLVDSIYDWCDDHGVVADLVLPSEGTTDA